MLTFPMRMLLLAIAGWLNQEQREKIEFLQEQVGVLLELHGTKRVRFNDDQRRRLAAKGKRLGRRVLRELPEQAGRRWGLSASNDSTGMDDT